MDGTANDEMVKDSPANSETQAEPPRFHFAAWLSRRRIQISVLTFAVLIGFNLLVIKTRPHNPFASWDLASWVGTSLVLIGVAIRSWAAGTLHKSEEVTNVGPYALVRNPLYVGSFSMMIGFCVLMSDWLALAFVAGPMTILYWFQVRVEEQNLAAWFSDGWQQYVYETGRFLPRALHRRAFVGWSSKQWLKNREYQALWATILGLVALAAIHGLG